ncbi:MAG: efflux RND transporter periplasmic adaptor subunit [Gammaproteobacteria bacterium]|nr:efflux RND transporter periplasmic adaptor subunit [Gammaproteobacteria bacterium]
MNPGIIHYQRISGFSYRTFLFCLALLAGAFATVWLIYSTEPTAQKEGALKKSPMLVEVIEVNRADYTPRIKAMGVVKPAQRVTMKPQVSGSVVAVSDKFIPGSFLNKGDWLIKIDARDYELNIAQAEAELARAQTSYQLELAEQERAKTSFKLLGKNVSEEKTSLILREPQLRQAKAELVAAESALAEAQLDLERTIILMPFDGQVISQDVNLGSQVSPSDTISNIIGTDVYWVESTLPIAKLKWLANYTHQSFNSSLRATEPVYIRNKTTWDQSSVREGRLSQVIAELDQDTRMARVLVEVTNPLGLNSDSSSDSQDSPQKSWAPLIAGSYVETELPGKTLSDTVRLELEYLRKKNTVWVMQEQKLDIRSVEVALKDDNFAYISEGLQSGERVITTDLATVKQGATVRLKTMSPGIEEDINQLSEADQPEDSQSTEQGVSDEARAL